MVLVTETRRVGDAVVVTMPYAEPAVLADIMSSLLLALWRAGARGAFRGRRVLRTADLFPDACSGQADSAAFRARHEAAMREELAASARRVRSACRWSTATDDGVELILDQRAADDWFRALGHARALYLRPGTRWTVPVVRGGCGKRRRARVVAWLHYVQDRIAHAATAEQPCDCCPPNPAG